MKFDWSTIGEKIYSIVKGSCKSVSMYNAKGNSTIDPEDATRFFAVFRSFNRNLNDFTILVACHDEGHDSHIDLKTPNLINPKDFEQIHQLRNHIRKAIGEREGIKINWLVFDHAINPKEEAVNNIKESKDVSKVYGTTKSSFQQIGEAKLIIRHSAAVNENVHGARSRQIRALFVENKIGERFAYPHLHVSGARAFARHISNGGKTHDTVAEKLYSLSEDYIKLRRSANSLRLNESVNPVWVDRLRESMQDINRTLKSMHGPKGYNNVTTKMLEEATTEIDEETIHSLQDQLAECCKCPHESPGYGDLSTAARYIVGKGPIEEPTEEPAAFTWTARPDVTSRIAEFSTVAERLNWQLNELAGACSNETAASSLKNIAEQIANGVMPTEGDLNLFRQAYESSQNFVSDDTELPEETELNEYLDSFNEETIFAEEVTDEGNEFSGALAAAKIKGDNTFSVDGKKYNVKEDGTANECNMTSEGDHCPTHGMQECMSMAQSQSDKIDEVSNSPDDSDDFGFDHEDDDAEHDEDDSDYGDPRDYDDQDDDRSHFADPGGNSALRAATPDNPRDHACPTCGHPNRLTTADVDRGYQCDKCADSAETGREIDYYVDSDFDDDLNDEAPHLGTDTNELYEAHVARIKNLAGLK